MGTVDSPNHADRVRILVGVCSCLANRDRRDAVRRSWFRQTAPDIAASFFVGEGEVEGEPDVILLNVSDGYTSLAEKVRRFYQYALDYYAFDYLFKCDDDTYLRADRLRSLAGLGADFVGSSTLKAEGYASGGAGYLMSRRMVERLAGQCIQGQPPEDVWFSQLAVKSGYRLVSTDRLQGFGDRYPTPDNDVVTGHWLPPQDMTRIHNAFTTVQPPSLRLSVRHPQWTGYLTLYDDGTFSSYGGALPGGRWAVAAAGGALELHWYHWPADYLDPVPSGFTSGSLELAFEQPDGPAIWTGMQARGCPA